MAARVSSPQLSSLKESTGVLGDQNRNKNVRVKKGRMTTSKLPKTKMKMKMPALKGVVL
jgi:hypothetical protein